MPVTDELLRPGQAITMESAGLRGQVEQFLGGGGQGEVYRVSLGGQPLALKWFFPHSATTQQRAALETLVRKGPPTDRFLWPMDLATAQGQPGFGYVMALRGERYKGIVDLMKRRIEPSFRALVTAGLELANSYLQLHARGLCYRDISFGNIFFDPDSGEILICDNDNVAVHGDAHSGVLGTPRFMAPEVVRGEALPGIETDLYSLAVLLFYMLIVHHPLEGVREAAIKCLDLPAMTKLYGTDPLFIFDPDDRANAPLPGCHDNALAFWPLYPAFLRSLFTRAFTTGLRDPENGRVRESEWRAVMARLRDAIYYCPSCSAENFYDIDAVKAASGKPAPCWACDQIPVLPARLRLGDGLVMLNHDSRLYPHHLDPARRYDFSTPLAEVARHPTDPQVIGLRNVSAAPWQAASGQEPERSVEPGKSIRLAGGLRIRFGKAEGEVRV